MSRTEYRSYNRAISGTTIQERQTSDRHREHISKSVHGKGAHRKLRPAHGRLGRGSIGANQSLHGPATSVRSPFLWCCASRQPRGCVLWLRAPCAGGILREPVARLAPRRVLYTYTATRWPPVWRRGAGDCCSLSRTGASGSRRSTLTTRPCFRSNSAWALLPFPRSLWSAPSPATLPTAT